MSRFHKNEIDIFKRSVFMLVAILSFLTLMLFRNVLYGGVSTPTTTDSATVVGTANGNIVISKAQLDNLTNQYLATKSKSKKSEVTNEEKVQLVKNAILRRLILQQSEVAAIRKDPDISVKVKEYEDNLVIAAFLKRQIGERLGVTEEEAHKYYETNREQYAMPAKVHASHILLRTRAEAESIIQKLHNGDDFSQLARDYSIDLPSASKGGEMGILEQGKALPELDKALFSMAKGEISNIVETPFGFHVLRVDEIYPPDFKPFDDVRKQIESTLAMEKERTAYDQMAEKIEANANMKVFEDRICAKDGVVTPKGE